MGGFKNAFSYMTNEVFAFTPETGTWEQKADIPGSFDGLSHSGNAVHESRQELYLVGGIALFNGESW